MRIGIQSQGLFPTRQKKKNKDLQSALLKLSTAQRINSASDDAAGLVIAEKLSSRIRGFKAAGRNVQDAMSALNVSEGATDRVTEMVQRQRELALQASNGTLSDDDRALLNTEFQQISSEINRIANDTEFNGQKVTNGTELADGTSEVAAGPDGSDTINLPGINLTTDTLGLTGIDIGTGAGAEAALTALDGALENISSQRAEIGATTNQFGSIINTLQTAEVNTVAAESVIRDQDMAKGISELIKQQLLSKSGNKAFSMFNRISNDHVMNLLQ